MTNEELAALDCAVAMAEEKVNPRVEMWPGTEGNSSVVFIEPFRPSICCVIDISGAQIVNYPHSVVVSQFEIRPPKSVLRAPLSSTVFFLNFRVLKKLQHQVSYPKKGHSGRTR